jgi:hypothetical protein
MSILRFENFGLFLSSFSSPGSFYFLNAVTPEMYKNLEKI